MAMGFSKFSLKKMFPEFFDIISYLIGEDLPFKVILKLLVSI